MTRSHVNCLELEDCREFRQTLQARVPKLVHSSAVLLSLLVATAVAWASCTQVNLVVTGHGRMRPIDSPHLVYAGLTMPYEARVDHVSFREGMRVRQGDVLIRLDTKPLDNEIAKIRETIEAGQRELAKLRELESLTAKQFQVARSKATAEFEQWQRDLAQLKSQRDTKIEKMNVELQLAGDEHDRMKKLVDARTASQREWQQTRARLRLAELGLQQARLPINDSRTEVLARAIDLIEHDERVRGTELVAKREARQGEVEALQKELANLLLQRERTVMRAPINGVITAGDVKVGDVLAADRPALEISQSGQFAFEAYVDNQDMAPLRIDMPARIKFDAFDHQTYGTLTGRVTFISPDSRLQAASDSQHAAYLVKIAPNSDRFDRVSHAPRIKLGMTGKVEIVTEQKSLLHVLASQIRRTISFN